MDSPALRVVITGLNPAKWEAAGVRDWYESNRPIFMLPLNETTPGDVRALANTILDNSPVLKELASRDCESKARVLDALRYCISANGGVMRSTSFVGHFFECVKSVDELRATVPLIEAARGAGSRTARAARERLERWEASKREADAES